MEILSKIRDAVVRLFKSSFDYDRERRFILFMFIFFSILIIAHFMLDYDDKYQIVINDIKQHYNCENIYVNNYKITSGYSRGEFGWTWRGSVEVKCEAVKKYDIFYSNRNGVGKFIKIDDLNP